MRRYRLTIASTVAADPATVWAVVSTMAGVNAELAPVRMSAPAGAAIDASVPLGRVAFASWITWRGIVPLDRHQLTLVGVEPGVGFDEASRSWLEATWEHRRRLAPVARGCRVADEVVFAPRLAGALVARVVARTFERRHRRLRERFGEVAGEAAAAPRASVAAV